VEGVTVGLESKEIVERSGDGVESQRVKLESGNAQQIVGSIDASDTNGEWSGEGEWRGRSLRFSAFIATEARS
jgi:hypothetical protein